MKIQINITKQILEQSKNCNSKPITLETLEERIVRSIELKVGQNCAIGKAIYNLFGDKSWVMQSEILIDKDGINVKSLLSGDWFNYQSNLLKIVLPSEATYFIVDFDRLTSTQRLQMKPFSFEVNVPDEIIDLIGIDQVTKILQETPSLDLVQTT